MGIFSRISKVLESNVTALVEKAEDPAKMLDQAIEDLKKGREEARQAIIEAKTELRLAEKRRDKALAEAKDFEHKAMQALQANNEDLARKCLERKISSAERGAAEDGSIAESQKQIVTLQAAEKELDRRIQEMPAKRATLLARQSVAEAKGARTGAASKAKDRVANAMDAIDRMEERIIRAEVEAEVRSDLEPSLGAELLALEDHRADRELEALKAKMAAQLPSGEPEKPAEPPAPAASAIEDSLAELKAKLGQKD